MVVENRNISKSTCPGKRIQRSGNSQKVGKGQKKKKGGEN